MKKINKHLIQYEVRNLTGNVFIIIFGVFFPILMSVLCINVFMTDVPKEYRQLSNNAAFITMSLIIPMATVLIGFAATFSQELEHGMPLRLGLFGYEEKSLLGAKMIANLIVLSAGLLLYVCADYLLLDIQVPCLFAGISLIVCIYVIAVILFVLAYGISLFFQKFAPAYACTMVLYFVFMIFSGMFGVRPSQLPGPMRFISKCLPMSYISEDFCDFWRGGSYNFVPMIQSMIYLSAVSGIILILAIKRRKRA